MISPCIHALLDAARNDAARNLTQKSILFYRWVCTRIVGMIYMCCAYMSSVWQGPCWNPCFCWISEQKKPASFSRMNRTTSMWLEGKALPCRWQKATRRESKPRVTSGRQTDPGPVYTRRVRCITHTSCCFAAAQDAPCPARRKSKPRHLLDRVRQQQHNIWTFVVSIRSWRCFCRRSAITVFIVCITVSYLLYYRFCVLLPRIIVRILL